jgi:hypothetical protein
MRQWAVIIFTLIFLSIFGYKVVAERIPDPNWLLVKEDMNYTISGIALIEQQENNFSFLIVHDNKGGEEGNRFAIIGIRDKKSLEYLPLKLSDPLELPRDLEAITVVPGQDKLTFVAAASSGRAYHVELDPKWRKLSLISPFYLPWMYHAPSNFEALAIQKIEGNLIIAWADRGETREPIRCFFGLLNLQTHKIDRIVETRISIPFPEGNVRLSDLKIDPAGIVYFTAALDNGNDSPFESAVYIAGAIDLEGDKIIFHQSELFPLYRIDTHKVEAIELIPGAKGGIVLGSDDENKGGAIGFYPR